MGVGVRSVKVMELATDGAATTCASAEFGAWVLGARTAFFAPSLALRWGFHWEVCVCVCVEGGGIKKR